MSPIIGLSVSVFLLYESLGCDCDGTDLPTDFNSQSIYLDRFDGVDFCLYYADRMDVRSSLSGLCAGNSQKTKAIRIPKSDLKIRSDFDQNAIHGNGSIWQDYPRQSVVLLPIWSPCYSYRQ